MSQERVWILISGHVQGVFFRASTKRKAIELGILGWVRNLADGRIEILAHGDTKSLEQLVKWCQDGPEWARVDKVKDEWTDKIPKSEIFTEFTIEPTSSSQLKD